MEVDVVDEPVVLSISLWSCLSMCNLLVYARFRRWPHSVQSFQTHYVAFCFTPPRSVHGKIAAMSSWRGRGRGGGRAATGGSSTSLYGGGGVPSRGSGYGGGHRSIRDEDAQPNLDEGRNLRSANYVIGRREPEPAPPLVYSTTSWPARGSTTAPSSVNPAGTAATAAAAEVYRGSGVGSATYPHSAANGIEGAATGTVDTLTEGEFGKWTSAA